jgi:lipid-A-disaccharide synthase
MRQAGAEMILDSSRLSVVGITEILGRGRSLWNAYRAIKGFLKKSGLSLLILIDFPDFNLLLARTAKKVGVPVLYYISPQVWAWRSGRVSKIARYVNKMAVIFPFEIPIYQKTGMEVEFVGHPLLDILGTSAQGRSPLDEEFKGDPLIALLPGSREKEIQSLLPEMVQAADILTRAKPGAKFILPAAPTVDAEDLRENIHSQSATITVVEGQTYAAIRAADLVIVASGTATLETAIMGKPMVIIYRVSPLSYWVGKAMVKVNWVGLVNIVAGKGVVPELLQGEAKGRQIADAALRILDDETYRRGMLEDLAAVREKLGTPGASRRVAKIALDMIGAEKKGVESWE